VNNSSQEQIFTITLDDDKTIETLTSTANITVSDWDPVSIPALTSSDIITLNGSTYNYGSTSIGTIESIDLSKIESFTSFTNLYKEEFDGRWPEYDRVMDMCKEYPGLEIAYRKFKEVYKMVKEDYDGKQRERKAK
jgi:hypothetical protein